MLSDAIKVLVELGQRAKAVDVIAHPSLPELVFVRHGDQLTQHSVPPPPRKPTLAGLNDLVAMLRDRGIAGSPEVAHGRETLGRSVEAVVQQAEQVPEAFIAQVPIWTTPGCPWTRPVEFSIYLDVEKSAVELSVLSDSCTAARNGALSQLRDALVEALGEVPVFMGAP